MASLRSTIQQQQPADDDPIDITTVRRVLLADGWHDVCAETFAIGAYQYRDIINIPSDGQAALAALWRELSLEDKAFKRERGWVKNPHTVLITVPLSSILAVQHGATVKADRLVRQPKRSAGLRSVR